MDSGARKVGDWNGVLMAIASIRGDMERARVMSLKHFGLKAEKIAVNHIRNNDLGWAPLDPKYKASKIKRGYSESIYVMTSTYIQSITSWVEGNKSYAGVKKDVTHPKEGGGGSEKVYKIAAILEYGSEKMPKRPLWQPTYKETLKWWRESATPLHFMGPKYKPV